MSSARLMEKEILRKMNRLPPNKKNQVYEFINFLSYQAEGDEEKALLALPGFRSTWQEAKDDIQKNRTISLKKIRKTKT